MNSIEKIIFEHTDCGEKNESCGTDKIKTKARIVTQHKNYYDVEYDNKIILAQVSGRFINDLYINGGYPVVGDFVELKSVKDDFAIIESIMPRKTIFFRKDMWNKTGTQILAANFDIVFICSSLNKDFNIKRLERYVVLAKSSGAEVVIVLTKCDLCEEYEEIISQCMEYFEGIKTIAISVVTDVGISELRQQFNGNKVGLLIGSSGVGKSSLVNKLCMRQVMNTGEIRQDDDRGKHTTVSRHMIYFDEGIIVDTPGLREIGIVESAESIKDVYNDIETIGSYCKFNNCTHTSEKGCAVLEEIRKGNLSLDRYQNYLKIRKENDLLSDRDKYLYDKWQKSKERSREFRKIRRCKK